MTNSSDSDSLELHDIPFDEDHEDAFFYLDEFSLSAQIRAVLQNDLDSLKQLISSGKCVNIVDNNGNTALHHVIHKNNREIFDYLLTLDDIRLDCKNFEGKTALHLAASLQYDYFVQELVNHGADFDETEYNGTTVLHYLAKGAVESVKFLLDRGAYCDAIDSRGSTPLHVAACEGKIEIINLLLEAGADCHICDKMFCVPFAYTRDANLPDEELRVFFLMTFDKFSTVSLVTISEIMCTRPSYFNEIISLDVELTYSSLEIDFFFNNYYEIDVSILEIFIEKYSSIFDSIVENGAIVDIFFRFFYTKNSHFFLLFKSRLKNVIINYLFKLENIRYIIASDIEENLLSSLIFGLLSYGYNLTLGDLFAVLRFYGFGSLARMLLHHSLRESVDIQLLEDFKVMNLNNRRYRDFLNFFSIFYSSKFLKICLNETSKNEIIPLFQLALQKSRYFIIEKYKIKSHDQFFTIVKALPIANWLRKVLSFEDLL